LSQFQIAFFIPHSAFYRPVHEPSVDLFTETGQNIGQIIIEYSNYFLVSQPFETFQSVLIFFVQYLEMTVNHWLVIFDQF